MQEITVDKIFLTKLYILAFQKQREVISAPQLTRCFSRKQRGSGPHIMLYPKPDFSKILPKVDSWRKQTLRDKEEVSGKMTGRVVQMKLINVPCSLLTFLL